MTNTTQPTLSTSTSSTSKCPGGVNDDALASRAADLRASVGGTLGFAPAVNTAEDVASTSRGIGRLYARTTVGSGPRVIHGALTKARAKFGAVESDAFVAGWHDERRYLSQG